MEDNNFRRITREEVISIYKERGQNYTEKDIMLAMIACVVKTGPVYEQRVVVEPSKINLKEDTVVIVISTDNYTSQHSEPLPFKAEVIKQYEHETVVKSLVTGAEYELYDSQILEKTTIAEMKNMIDVSKCGEKCNE